MPWIEGGEFEIRCLVFLHLVMQSGSPSPLSLKKKNEKTGCSEIPTLIRDLNPVNCTDTKNDCPGDSQTQPAGLLFSSSPPASRGAKELMKIRDLAFVSFHKWHSDSARINTLWARFSCFLLYFPDSYIITQWGPSSTSTPVLGPSQDSAVKTRPTQISSMHSYPNNPG